MTLLTGLLAAPFRASAEDAKKSDKYPLKTCVVSDEKLGGDMGEPYVFTYKDKKIKDDSGREVRLCCKSCLKDFNKEPAKYIKKIDEAEKAAKAKK
ncbi:MAG: hypothetical protein JWQ71_1449 [Pedosphaera sp.]|nr:hypothetical protein [Pedosphaera sp.]